MNKAADKTPTTTGSESKSPFGDWAIALQLADTTARVAIPIVIFTLGGIWLDKQSGSKPLYTLIGLFGSLILSTILVYKQIKSAYPEFFKKEVKK